MKNNWKIGKTEDATAAANSSAGVPPAVAGASRPRFGEVTIRDRGRLPHCARATAGEDAGATANDESKTA